MSGKIIFVLLILILTMHGVGIWYTWYHTIWWIDNIMHIMGGVWIALLFFFEKKNRLPAFGRHLPFWFYFFLIISVVMFVGVVWEWFEYLVDILFFTEKAEFRAQLGLPDTMSDLIMDLIGGAVTTFYVISRERKNGV